MGSVTLSANEVLIMKDEGVGCQSTSIGVLRAVTSRGVERGTLVLTNKSLIFSPDKSIFSKKGEDVCLPLDTIKVSNGIAQIRPAKPDSREADYRLTVYCSDSQHIFLFPSSLRPRLRKWVEGVNEQVVGMKCGWNPEDLGLIDVKRAVTSAIDSAKPVAQGIADVAKPLIPIAAAVASVTPGRTGKLAAAALGAMDAIGGKESRGLVDVATHSTETADEFSVRTSEVSIDDQVGELKKLKELVDCGILTEEEFSAKKREILGL